MFEHAVYAVLGGVTFFVLLYASARLISIAWFKSKLEHIEEIGRRFSTRPKPQPRPVGDHPNAR